MACECPSCYRVSPVDTPFCPACGAPMTKEAERSRENARQNRANPGLMPMRWHLFLVWILLPFELIMGCVDLYDSIKKIVEFDASLFRPELLRLVQASVGLNLVYSVALLPLAAITEAALLRMRKRGPKMLLRLDLIKAVYGVVSFVLLLLAHLDGMTLISAGASAVEMILLWVINHIYYEKRETLFL